MLSDASLFPLPYLEFLDSYIHKDIALYNLYIFFENSCPFSLVALVLPV